MFTQFNSLGSFGPEQKRKLYIPGSLSIQTINFNTEPKDTKQKEYG